MDISSIRFDIISYQVFDIFKFLLFDCNLILHISFDSQDFFCSKKHLTPT